MTKTALIVIDMQQDMAIQLVVGLTVVASVARSGGSSGHGRDAPTPPVTATMATEIAASSSSAAPAESLGPTVRPSACA